MNSYFSVSDANEILPLVIKKFNYAKKAKAEVEESVIDDSDTKDVE